MHGRKDRELIRLLMERYRNMFDGKDVPEEVKELACLVMFRFIIDGEADGMGIANIIAHESGFGDGMGKFADEVEVDVRKCAGALVSAYPVGSYAMEELALMLEYGTLEYSMARAGILRDIRETKEAERHASGWRREYLEKQNAKRQEALDLVVRILEDGRNMPA